MGHAHDHNHGDRSQYFKEQIATIGVCGAFAVVTLVLWGSGALNKLLAQKFHIWVLLGGAALLIMAVINGVAVWLSAGEAKAAPGHSHDHDDDHDHDHAHDHAHGDGHGHDHAHCDHHHHDHDHGDHAHDHSHGHDHGEVHDHAPVETGVRTTAAAPLVAANVQTDAPAVTVAPPAPAPSHDHGHDGHDHAWAPWRYAVLLLPVAIYFVVPLEALSAAGAKPVEVDVSSAAGGTDLKQDDFSVSFQQLELASLYPENRGFYEGKTVRLVGQYVPKNDRMFTLRRVKISCCIADGVPLNAVIMIDPKIESDQAAVLPSNQLQGKWVQVTGRVEFLPRAGGAGYATTLILTPTKERSLLPTDDHADALVKEVPPPANPYLN